MSYKFKEEWDDLATSIHILAQKKGWWADGVVNRNKGELIALMHSELSEALEALRHGNGDSDKIPEFSGVEEELADTVIRIMDYARAFNMDVAGAILAKHRMNEGREHKHGGKAF